MQTETMAPVVVGVDGSMESIPGALELAAEEAAARVTPLVVVFAHHRLIGTRVAGPRNLAREHDLLTVAVADALADHPGLAVSARLAVGDPARVLIAQSRQANLLVVGHRSGPRTVAGASLAVALAGNADCPVLVHRTTDPARQSGQPRPVLVGIGGGPGSAAAVEFAFEEAALRGAPLRAMHVAAQDPTTARIVLAEALTGWSEKYPDVTVCRSTRPGPTVAAALIEASREAQLVVVGGRRPIQPTVAALIDHAGCPVAVVPLTKR